MQIAYRFDRIVQPLPLPYLDKFEYKVFIGRRMAHLIEPLRALRIQCFREYPHLYDGNPDNEYEKQCAEELCRNERTIVVTVHCGNTLVGFTTAFPLVRAAEILDGDDSLFLRSGYGPSDFYYWSEAAIAPKFRGYNILSRFNERIESQAAEWGYAHMCLATVVRDENDPRKPCGYRDPGPLWRRFGYSHTDILFAYSWPTRMEDGSSRFAPNKIRCGLKTDFKKRG